ncbi:MAG: FkbM family methyltransferase [Phycisphaerales bacterium]|nr:FkbM family methyltransferase [Phycisphaerales bacterium]
MSTQPAKFPSLIDLLGPASPMLTICDVGAMALESDPDPLLTLMMPGKHRVIGFEPVPAECEKLNRNALPGHTYLPYFVGDGRERTFHLTSAAMCSSLYEPNTPLLALFQQLPEVVRTAESSKVKTKRLDDLIEVQGTDYLKLDVQGAELDVLNGAEKLLRDSVCVVKTEVEFVPLYKGQPLFGDIDAKMRSLGFMLHTFYQPAGRCYWPFVFGGNPDSNGSQAMWTDAFYIRDLTVPGSMTPDQMLKTAIFVHDVLQSYDLAAMLLARYDEAKNTSLWNAYMKLFMPNPPAKAPQRPPLA